MPAEHFPSPNAIPPRTSSHHARNSSVSNGAGPNGAAAGLAGTSSGLNTSASGISDPSKLALRPLSENKWMAQSHTHGTSGSEDTIRAIAPTSQMADRVVAAAVPPPPPPSGKSSDGTPASTWTAEKEKIVLGPYEYLHDRPGKNIRTQLVSAFNHWLQVPKERLVPITRVIGMLHTASLLIDDIEDSSVLRRGVPVAHNIFGTAQTLNSANYVYFGALQELLKLGNPKFTTIYCEELCNLHRGQGLDLYWRDTLTCPSEAEYLEMVGNKTAGLFRLAIKLMQAESESNKDFVPLVNLMGIIFQIRDDYLNLWSPTYSDNKGLCEDLTEGKFSYPIIHAIRADPRNSQLLNILKQKPTDPAVKKYATDYMDRVGSFAHCRIAVKELVERALKMVTDLDGGAAGPNDQVKTILNHFLLD